MDRIGGAFEVTACGVTVGISVGELRFRVRAGGRVWEQDQAVKPGIWLDEDEVLWLEDAQTISHRRYDSGAGTGILSSYEGFRVKGEEVSFSLETLVWIEYATGDVRFELIPGREGLTFRQIRWPAPFSFDLPQDEAVSVLPVMQGILIPNTWENQVKALPFDGQMCSAGAYMPWFGQIEQGKGYIAVCEQPWDAGYYVDHPAGGPYTRVGMYFLPSLGQLSYRRVVRYSFLNGCDYNDLCKVYRAYARETGLLTTLAQKAARNPLVEKLIGAAIVHKGIKTHVSPDSVYYDREHPERNDAVIPFAVRTEEIQRYYEKGIRRLYLHLDGWGDPGYDNKHPDYLPACEEAGGWDAMKELSDTIQKCGYMFGLHDQYRDYYMDAPSYDREFACQAPDGSVFDMARWAGGRQSYLCATQAPYYVKRNFQEVLRHGIHLEASYLDVFTCNEGDECANPRHRMTRRECLEYRGRCFDYLWSKGILPSSEECGDWAMRQLVFCHYGPYDFMLAKPGTPRRGIPAPLFNLVYHDCMILPWPMDRLPDTEDYMLYALLNGGAAYVDKDGAYPGCDGAFDEARDKQLDEEIARYQVVSELQQRVAGREMVRHEFIDGDVNRQRTVFSDGTEVTVDLGTGKWDVTYGHNL
ncbi:MAG: hypothetical protein HFI38_01505 [Lachnospiraceae bacterium]|nr:hypothetical protein [Lachnospiraceae bacterium]